MHYIRFLKPPNITSSRNSRWRKLGFLVTLTTDLGDDFFLGKVGIEATLWCEGHDGQSVQRKTSAWEAGMRSLACDFDLRAFSPNESLQVEVVAIGPESKDIHASSQPFLARVISPIVPAWSVPFTPSSRDQAVKQVERRFHLTDGDLFTIREETGESIARHVWDAGVVLTALLCQWQKSLLNLRSILEASSDRTLNVVELGSGCGIVGLGIAQAFPQCNVLLTDLAEAEEIIGDNIALARPAPDSTVDFHVLDWDEEIPDLIKQRAFDLITFSDCTYNPSSLPALVRTLVELVRTSPTTLILAALKIRHPSEEVFFDLMAEAGLSQVEHRAVFNPQAQACEDLQDPERIDVFVFKATERC